MVSYSYICVIAVLQIIGGILLLFNKTKLIGAMILFPILFNVVLIDLFYKVCNGATAMAINLLLCLSILLYNQRSIFSKLLLPTDKSYYTELKSVGGIVKTILIYFLLIFSLSIIELIFDFTLGRVR